MLKNIWSPLVITAVAIVGTYYQWSKEIIWTIVGVVFVCGLVTTYIFERQRKSEYSFNKLKGLGGYFVRRFSGNSPLSIFAIINSAASINDHAIQEWIRQCNTAQLIYDSWSNGYINRLESDTKPGNFDAHIRIHILELWSLVVHYHEFVEQFHELASKIRLSNETVEQFNRFATEYNAFVQKLQEYISTLRRFNRTEVEPSTIKQIKEIKIVKDEPPPKTQPSKLPKRDDNMGYIL